MADKKTDKKALTTVFLIAFIDLFGYGLILPLLPYIAERFGANALQIGFLVASYSFFQFISSPILGQLSDRYGRKNLLVISQIGSAIGFMLLGIAGSLPLLFVSRILDGTTGGNLSIAQAYIADVTSKKDRAKGMGIIGAAFGLGFILSPAIGGLLAKYSFAAPAYFAAAMSLITALATKVFLRETVDLDCAKGSPKTRLSISDVAATLRTEFFGTLIISFFIYNIGQSIVQGVFALWAETTFGYEPFDIGLILAYVGVLAVITQLKILPVIVERLGEIRGLKTATLLMGVGILLLVPANQRLLKVVVVPLIALGVGLSFPIVQAISSEKVGRYDYGEALGVLQAAGSLGRIAGPIIGGELFFYLGKNVPFLIAGALVLIAFVYLQVRFKKA